MDDVDAVYSCMKRHPSGDPLLGEFRDIDTIRSQLSLLHDPQKKTVYLVYGDESERAGQEVCFRIVGYIATFDLPGHGITKRCALIRDKFPLSPLSEHIYFPRRAAFKPYTLKQRVGIVAKDSPDFDQDIEGLTSLSTYLQEFSIDGAAKNFYHSKAFGLNAVLAQTDLFTKIDDAGDDEECQLPRYIDPSRNMMELIHQSSFRYTRDNVVEYSEFTEAITDG